MGAGRWGKRGGGERREGGGRAQAKYTEVQTQHNKTQNTREEEVILKEGNPKVGEGRSPDILLQGEVGVLNIQ